MKADKTKIRLALFALAMAAGFLGPGFSAQGQHWPHWPHPPQTPHYPFPPPAVSHSHPHSHTGEHGHFHSYDASCEIHAHGHSHEWHEPHPNYPDLPHFCSGCPYGEGSVCRTHHSGRFCRQFAVNYQRSWFSACVAIPPFIFSCAEIPASLPSFSSVCAPLGAPCACDFQDPYGHGWHYEFGSIQL